MRRRKQKRLNMNLLKHHHFSGDELRCRSVGNHGCRDDDVHVRDNPCISGKLGCHEFIAHDLGSKGQSRLPPAFP